MAARSTFNTDTEVQEVPKPFAHPHALGGPSASNEVKCLACLQEWKDQQIVKAVTARNIFEVTAQKFFEGEEEDSKFESSLNELAAALSSTTSGRFNFLRTEILRNYSERSAIVNLENSRQKSLLLGYLHHCLRSKSNGLAHYTQFENRAEIRRVKNGEASTLFHTIQAKANFQKAAKLGDRNALCYLAAHYYQPEDDKALTELTRELKLEDKQLAKYRSADKTPYPVKLDLLTYLAEKNPRAVVLLLRLYIHPFTDNDGYDFLTADKRKNSPNPAKLSKALFWLDRALSQGSFEALEILYDFFQRDCSLPSSSSLEKDIYLKLVELYSIKKLNMDFGQFQEFPGYRTHAAEEVSLRVKALMCLSQLYSSNIINKQNIAKASTCLSRAINLLLTYVKESDDDCIWVRNSISHIYNNLNNSGTDFKETLPAILGTFKLLSLPSRLLSHFEGQMEEWIGLLNKFVEFRADKVIIAIEEHEQDWLSIAPYLTLKSKAIISVAHSEREDKITTLLTSPLYFSGNRTTPMLFSRACVGKIVTDYLTSDEELTTRHSENLNAKAFVMAILRHMVEALPLLRGGWLNEVTVVRREKQFSVDNITAQILLLIHTAITTPKYPDSDYIDCLNKLKSLTKDFNQSNTGSTLGMYGYSSKLKEICRHISAATKEDFIEYFRPVLSHLIATDEPVQSAAKLSFTA